MRKVRSIKKIYLLPNLVTTACLLAGTFAIIRAMEGQYTLAAWSILVASILDALDGRLARLTHSESPFGVQYDSLADMVSFGLAPAILVYAWTLHIFGRLGMVISFLYVTCTALRLARFNVQTSKSATFEGLPTPAAACFLTTFVIFHSHIYGAAQAESYLALALCFLAALLMISTIGYFSLKGIQFHSRRSSFYYLLAGITIMYLVALEPRVAPFVFCASYVVFGMIYHLFSRKRPAVVDEVKIHQARRKKSGSVQLLQIKQDTGSESP